jgi:RNA polymerase sigma-70 factor (ECF subfamily)
VTPRFRPATDFWKRSPGELRGTVAVSCALPTDERTDEELIAEAAREGSDGPAFVALMARHRERVWRICYRLLGNEHDAQDAAQEVFVRLFVHRGKFAGRSRFSTWLHGLAIRTCLTLRRGRGRRLKRVSPTTDESLIEGAADSRAATDRLGADVMQMLEVLDEEDRALLILKYAEGYSHEELAEMFDLSVSACKMRISRARERVQRSQPRD